MRANYWSRRQDLKYYQEVRRLIERFSPGESFLDVGCANTPIVTWGDFKCRCTVDLETDPELPGVESFIADFTTWLPPRARFSLVTCLQTIEHLRDEEVRPFVDMLHEISERLIISLPFKWKRSWTKTHYQDPIDMEKLNRIMDRPYSEVTIIRDNGLDRVVALYE